MSTPGPTGSIAILHDMTEEGWASMDQMGALLTTRVPAFAPGLRVTPIHHPLRRFVSVGPLARARAPFFVDRVINRMALYPRRVRRTVAGRFDLYHVVDHSYAQLALELPAPSTIVTCHDVDTFRSIVKDGGDRRPAWFRAMTRRILRGLRRAAVVVCGSQSAHDDLVRFGLVAPGRLRVVPNGIDPAFVPPPQAEAIVSARALLPRRDGTVDIPHVGNDIPRKRVDRLLRIVAALRDRGRALRLVRVGSPFRPETREVARALGLDRVVVELPFLDRAVLRAVYELSDVVLMTSDREGLGLPVLEAFAAGKPVVASDIPALRESSAGLAACVPPDDLDAWVSEVEKAIDDADHDGSQAAARRARAAAVTWDHHVRGLLPIYADLLDRKRASGR